MAENAPSLQSLAKMKRRDRDARLKRQADLRVKRKRKSDLPLQREDDEPPAERQPQVSTKDLSSTTTPRLVPDGPLPALLPDEILQAEPTVIPPTPPPEIEKHTQKPSKRRRLLEIQEKPPRDVKQGNTVVRVLDVGVNVQSTGARAGTTSVVLPPKPMRERNIREEWMARHRRNGVGRKVGGRLNAFAR